jgi:hypothetical protein
VRGRKSRVCGRILLLPRERKLRAHLRPRVPKGGGPSSRQFQTSGRVRDCDANKSPRRAQADGANRKWYHAPKSRHTPYDFFLLREALRDSFRKSLDLPISYTAILDL